MVLPDKTRNLLDFVFFFGQKERINQIYNILGENKMTNIFGTPTKGPMKTRLFKIAEKVLEEDGWQIERMVGTGKSSLRRITKGGESKVISIRTSQDTWIAFPRAEGDDSWGTLDDVDAVVPVSVDHKDDPKFAKVHLIDGDEMRSRFNRAYEARKEAGYSIPTGRGVWVSLYQQETREPVTLVGAGAGLKFPPIATVSLLPEAGSAADDTASSSADNASPFFKGSDEAPLSIAEAKRRLAETFGVDPACIKITVEA
ncbi:hypothetical protein [Roseobacter sp. GAI101]|uniref:hypothetical protein n=1 Tax=Roseobacter sp. (strain GAI101) TaxID=391589 RepID=UPI0018DE7FAB|nr:hypothetical protein [Roseobacter sp. GAI101]